MDRRRIMLRHLASLSLLLCSMTCVAEKLSPDQKAPPFARGSGGLILKTPFEGEQRFGGSPPLASNSVDGVEREETETLKLVDGELVRTVQGHFAYKSPEGLPIAVEYTADENGNRASFKFGSGQFGGGQISSGGTRTSGANTSGGPPTRGPKQESPPSDLGNNGDKKGPTSSRTYLPPN